jgi:hypothetical protein
MAKAPSARVPKTSGQGVSRLSYQKGYALGNKGAQGGKPPSVGGYDDSSVKTGKSYAKGDSGGDAGLDFSYGENLAPGNINSFDDVKAYGKLKQPKASPITKAAKPKAWKTK